MINLNATEQSLKQDPNLLKSTENTDLSLGQGVDFQQLIQSQLDLEHALSSKAEPSLADDGQIIAAQEEILPDILANMTEVAGSVEDEDLQLSTQVDDSQALLTLDQLPTDADSTQINMLVKGAGLPQAPIEIKMEAEGLQPINVLPQQQAEVAKQVLLHDVYIPSPAELKVAQSQAMLANGDVKAQVVDNELKITADNVKQLESDLNLKGQTDLSAKDADIEMLLAKQANNASDKMAISSLFAPSSADKTKAKPSLVADLPSIKVDNTTQAQSQSQLQTRLTTPTAANALPESFQAPMKMDDTWGKSFHERLVLMARNGFEKALIQIDPPELGPIEVKVSMDGQAANLQITTNHQSIKDLIQGQMHQLIASFESSGMELVDVDVSTQQESDFSFKGQSFEQKETVVETIRRQDSDGLLDIYV